MTKPDHMDELLTQREAAAEIGVTARTLRNWRRRGLGPPFSVAITNPKRHIYTRREIKNWRKTNTHGENR